ncbi:MAG: T9SS type A sorting domain-containing protein [Bacteroidales bacterium]
MSDNGVYFEDQVIKSWAVSCKIIRGYMRIDDKESGRVTAGEDNACLGKADNVTVSLGDSGIAVLSFAEPVKNIEGYDFAVFENSFDGNFLEFAFTEVSTDSIKWVRFPSKSLTQTNIQTGTFGTTNPEMVNNLAGKYRVYYGTPFDLEEIRDSGGINISNIKYIRIIDVIGSVDDRYASRDAFGNKINDPWPTPFPQGGFDLDAVALLRTPAGINTENINSEAVVYPNPASEKINIVFPVKANRYICLCDLCGKKLKKWNLTEAHSVLDISAIPPGLYLLLSDTDSNNRNLSRLIILK